MERERRTTYTKEEGWKIKVAKENPSHTVNGEKGRNRNQKMYRHISGLFSLSIRVLVSIFLKLRNSKTSSPFLGMRRDFDKTKKNERKTLVLVLVASRQKNVRTDEVERNGTLQKEDCHLCLYLWYLDISIYINTRAQRTYFDNQNAMTKSADNI